MPCHGLEIIWMSIFGIVTTGFSFVDCDAALPTFAILEGGSNIDYDAMA